MKLTMTLDQLEKQSADILKKYSAEQKNTHINPLKKLVRLFTAMYHLDLSAEMRIKKENCIYVLIIR